MTERPNLNQPLIVALILAAFYAIVRQMQKNQTETLATITHTIQSAVTDISETTGKVINQSLTPVPPPEPSTGDQKAVQFDNDNGWQAIDPDWTFNKIPDPERPLVDVIQPGEEIIPGLDESRTLTPEKLDAPAAPQPKLPENFLANSFGPENNWGDYTWHPISPPDTTGDKL